jgi:hypothetical protein
MAKDHSTLFVLTERGREGNDDRQCNDIPARANFAGGDDQLCGFGRL